MFLVCSIIQEHLCLCFRGHYPDTDKEWLGSSLLRKNLIIGLSRLHVHIVMLLVRPHLYGDCYQQSLDNYMVIATAYQRSLSAITV